jgi:deazaflavin-dependent oxidoreductase (nitroreductase family)
MKLFMKFFMGLHVFFYRLTGGRLGGTMNGFKVLILTTKGRKSGKLHTNAVGYLERDGGYIIVASNGGQATHPAWYHNLKAAPNITIQVMDKVMPVHAEILAVETRAALWKWVVESAPAFGKYEKSTTRQIPLVMLKSAR